MLTKTNDGRFKDVAIAEVNAENYIVPEKEKGFFHCVIEIRKFDANTGKRLSVPRIQKFEPKSFKSSIAAELKKQGYTIEILHDPTDYLAMTEQQRAELAADEQRKAAEALAAKKQAEIDEAVAKALAEQKATEKERIAAAVAKELAKQTKKAGRPPKGAEEAPEEATEANESGAEA